MCQYFLHALILESHTSGKMQGSDGDDVTVVKLMPTMQHWQLEDQNSPMPQSFPVSSMSSILVAVASFTDASVATCKVELKHCFDLQIRRCE